MDNPAFFKDRFLEIMGCPYDVNLPRGTHDVYIFWWHTSYLLPIWLSYEFSYVDISIYIYIYLFYAFLKSTPNQETSDRHLDSPQVLDSQKSPKKSSGVGGDEDNVFGTTASSLW